MVKNPPANAGDMDVILVQEDPTCLRATKLVRQNYWACAPDHELQLLSKRATTTEPAHREPTREARAMKSSACSPQLEKSPSSNNWLWLGTANKQIKLKKKIPGKK